MPDYRVCICDDEETSAAYLSELVTAWGKTRAFSVQQTVYPSAEAFLFAWDAGSAADILLLDIEMPGLNGVELARRIRGSDRAVQIIFVTGYMDYLADGYDVEALHYLLKPVDAGKLYAVLDRAVQRLAERRESLLVEYNGCLYRLPLHEIRWAEVQGNYTTLHAGRDYTLKKPLKELASRLDDSFFRTGRSYIVNLRFVQSVSKAEVVLTDGSKVPLFRGGYDAIHRAMIAYF